MEKSKKIERLSSTQKLVYLQETICKIDIDRIKAAVNSIRKESDSARLSHIFSEMNNAFAEDEERLIENEHSHNENYANEDNGQYNTAYTSLCCIKASVFALGKIITALSPKLKIAKKYYQTDTNSIEFQANHCLIGTLPYTPYMFEDKTPTQNRLIVEIISFLNTFDRNITRVLGIIEKEKSIGDDTDECLMRLERQIDEIYQYVKGKNVKVKIDETDYYRDLIAVDSHPDNAKLWWHKLTPNQLTPIAVALKQERLSHFSTTEIEAFDGDEENIRQYRRMMRAIKKNDFNISGKIIVYARMYSNCTATESAFYNCFTETYHRIGGDKKIVTLQAYGQAFAKYYTYNKNPEEYIKFRDKIDLSL